MRIKQGWQLFILFALLVLVGTYVNYKMATAEINVAFEAGVDYCNDQWLQSFNPTFNITEDLPDYGPSR